MSDDLRSKRGRKPLDSGLKREHCVSVRLNADELAWLDSARGKYMRGEYMRMSAMNKLPPIVPAVNQGAWSEIGRIGVNLNQIARKLNSGEELGIDDIREQLSDLREKLTKAQR